MEMINTKPSISGEEIKEFKTAAQCIADEIFNGDMSSYGYILQQISIHYDIMEINLIVPIYAAWIHLKEHGFHTQEEIGEVMWNVRKNYTKEIWTHVAAFPITEYIKLIHNK